MECGDIFQLLLKTFVKKCVICAIHNVGRGVAMPLSAHPKSEGPFEHLMMGFIELTSCRGYKYCIYIIIVDMYFS